MKLLPLWIENSDFAADVCLPACFRVTKISILLLYCDAELSLWFMFILQLQWYHKSVKGPLQHFLHINMSLSVVRNFRKRISGFDGKSTWGGLRVMYSYSHLKYRMSFQKYFNTLEKKTNFYIKIMKKGHFFCFLLAYNERYLRTRLDFGGSIFFIALCLQNSIINWVRGVSKKNEKWRVQPVFTFWLIFVPFVCRCSSGFDRHRQDWVDNSCPDEVSSQHKSTQQHQTSV